MPRPFDLFPAALKAVAPWPIYRVVITEVVDGDSVYVLGGPGFEVALDIEIRLLGLQTPESRRGTAAEREAGRAAQTMLRGVLPVGAPAVLRSYRDPQRRTFTRWLGEVRTLPVHADPASLVTWESLMDVVQVMRGVQEATQNWGFGFPPDREWYRGSAGYAQARALVGLPDRG